MAETIKTRCPHCATILRLPANIQSDTLRCTKCQTLMRIKRQAPGPGGSTGAGAVMAPPPPPPIAPTAPAPVPPPPTIQSPQHGDSFGPTVSTGPVRYSGATQAPRSGGLALTVGLGALALVLLIGVVILIFWPFKGGNSQIGGGDVADNQGPGPAKVGGKAAGGAKVGGAFPRRALVLSVHNYLYANPVAAHGGNNTSAVAQLPDVLSKGKLNVPKDQVLWVSDKNEKSPQPLLKPVFEKTLGDFLSQSRPQDRILVTFVGHATVADKKAYLVPFEGMLDDTQTLVPLETVFRDLKACKAKQKILVLDICHANVRFGQERPGGESMSPELAAAIAAAPEGVEVIASCKETERSWETDIDPAGIFLSSISKVLSDGLKGQIQKTGDPIPVEKIAKETSLLLTQKAQELGKSQAIQSFGKLVETDVEDSADAPALVKVSGEQAPDKVLVERTGIILGAIHLPPLKGDTPDDLFEPSLFAALCDPKSKAIEGAAKAGAPPKDNKAYLFMEKAKTHLWAISGRDSIPGDVRPAVETMIKKKEIRKDQNLRLLRGGFRAAEDAILKRNVEANQRSVALILGLLDEDLAEMEATAEEKDELSAYWRANYDYITAKLEAQASYIWEYESMLGQMRKEAPARDPKIHGGWDLASIPAPQGDSKGKKLAKSSKKTFEALSKKYPNTPWDILSRREKGTSLGLEWQPVP